MTQRPFDCTECKKTVAVCYTEIVGDKMTRNVMCADCPHLEKKIYKMKNDDDQGASTEDVRLTCAECNTSLEQIRKGHLLGCAQCYEVFADVIVADLIKQRRISRHLTSNKKTQPLHIGRAKGEITEVSPTLRLIALNEALDEMLIREDYEQAALLRDQIEAFKKRGTFNEG